MKSDGMNGSAPAAVAAEARRLPAQVKALGLVSFANDAASEMVFPLLPAFVTSVLGLGPHVLGLMEGVAETVASVLKYLSGWWSDRVLRRKPLAVAGYALSSLLRPLMGLAGAGWHVVGLRAVDRVGKGLRTAPRDALLAAAVPVSLRGRAFGFHRAMDHAGAVVGPLIALALLRGAGLDLRTLFLWTAVPSLLTVILIVFAVREEAAPPRDAARGAVRPAAGASPVGDRRGLVVFLTATVLFTLGNSSDLFLVLRAHELGVPAALAPVLWIVLHLSKSLFATPGGALSDRIGRRRAILLGWGVYALCYAGFAAAGAAWQAWGLFVAYGLYYGLTEGAERALAADLLPAHLRGRGFGLYHMGIGLAALPSSVVAGYLWERHGAAAALGLGAALAGAAALVFLFGMPAERRRV